MPRSVKSGSGHSGAERVAAVCVALLLVACGPPAAPPGAGSPGVTSPTGISPTATASGTGPATSETSPSTLPSPMPSGWKTFTTSDRALTFDYPGDWSIKDPAGETPLGGVFVAVSNAAGRPMAVLQTNVVTGAECHAKYPFTALDSEPMTALAEKGVPNEGVPRYVFETRGDDAAPAPTRSTIAAYGITMAPEETGTLACPLFLLFTWPPSGALFGAGYNPENNKTPGDPSLPYLQKAKLYAETGEYRNIRRMITSLRPAE
jgi:hypothetical protein